MNIQTKGGIAEAMPLSDIQENNKLLRRLTDWLVTIGLFVVGYLVWITWYVMKNNVLNNIVRSCVG